MHLNKRRLSAHTVYLIFSGASSLFFAAIVTVNLVYQVEVAKLGTSLTSLLDELRELRGPTATLAILPLLSLTGILIPI